MLCILFSTSLSIFSVVSKQKLPSRQNWTTSYCVTLSGETQHTGTRRWTCVHILHVGPLNRHSHTLRQPVTWNCTYREGSLHALGYAPHGYSNPLAVTSYTKSYLHLRRLFSTIPPLPWWAPNCDTWRTWKSFVEKPWLFSLNVGQLCEYLLLAIIGVVFISYF